MFRSPARQVQRLQRGFTLIDVAMATAIVGTAVVSLCALLAAGTATSVDSAQQTQANSLIRSIREMCLTKRFSELPALNGRSYCPPIDSRTSAISILGSWRQTIQVQSVDPDRLTTTIIDNAPSAVRITVTAYHGSDQVGQESWYSFNVE